MSTFSGTIFKKIFELIIGVPAFLLLSLVLGCGQQAGNNSQQFSPGESSLHRGSKDLASTESLSPGLQAVDLNNLYCKLGDVPAFGASDGPASLPQACYYTSMSATPSNGKTITVSSSPGQLQTALNSVQCGDTLVLTAGQVYNGSFTLPALKCNKSQYITIQTSKLSQLPLEGTRISPCYNGVPWQNLNGNGRPQYSCPPGGPQKLMPTILADKLNQPALIVAPGANYYRLIGLEIAQAPRIRQAQLVDIGQADHIIIDRSWIHGSALDENQAGVHAAGTYIAIIDSYLNDSKCLSSGSCIDSQAIKGGTGTYAEGPIKIVNNFLESAGESFIYGGGPATTTPHDFEVRRNHSFKPLIWRLGTTGYPFPAGTHPIIKNLGELKNGIRALVEANIFEQNWEGQSDQAGFGFLLTPKNQKGRCPICIVTDVTFRYNTIRHVNQAMEIASVRSDTGALAKGIHRVSVHDNLFDDLNYFKWTPNTSKSCCVGGGAFQVSNGNSVATDITSDIFINHNTTLAIGYTSDTSNFISEIDGQVPNFPIKNLTVTNNISPAGVQASPKSSGGSTIKDVLLALKTVNGTSWQMTTNLLPMAVSSGTNSTHNYPTTTQTCGVKSATCFPLNFSGVFVNYNNGDGGDYHLSSSSPYKGAGTDKKDLGADVSLMDSYLLGVQ